MVVVVEERPSAQAERVISDQVKGRVAEQAEFRRGVEKWQFMQRAGGDYVHAVRREMIPMLSRRARSFACRPKAGLRDI